MIMMKIIGWWLPHTKAPGNYASLWKQLPQFARQARFLVFWSAPAYRCRLLHYWLQTVATPHSEQDDEILTLEIVLNLLFVITHISLCMSVLIDLWGVLFSSP